MLPARLRQKGKWMAEDIDNEDELEDDETEPDLEGDEFAEEEESFLEDDLDADGGGLVDDEEESDEEEAEAKPAPARSRRGSPADDEEEDEDEDDGDDVEASLDVILKERLVVEDVEVEDEDEEAPQETDDRSDASRKVTPRRPDEFVCQSCFLVKHPSQLADKSLQFCRDCV